MRFLLAIAMLSSLCWARTYSTNFSSTENPICESGNWQNGKTNGSGACAGIAGGVDWSDMATNAAYAYNVNGSGFTDGTSIVTGAWGATQYVRGVARCSPTDINPEIELRLRSSISAHSITGYEVDLGCKLSGGAFSRVVRWNGAVNDFTILHTGENTSVGPGTGDLVEATVNGCNFTISINGVQVATATDCTYSSGAPGIGSEQTTGADTDQGWSSFYASDGLSTTTIAALYVASGTTALATSAISSGTCATVVTASAPGTLATDAIEIKPNADPVGLTGYAVSASGSLYVQKYPTTNNVNFKVCNPTSGSLTPAALTLNWAVLR